MPACASHLDLIRASYVFYGIKYIDLVSPQVPPTIVDAIKARDRTNAVSLKVTRSQTKEMLKSYYVSL